MLSEQDFRHHCDVAIEALKNALIDAEEDADIEVEEQSGVINVAFDDPPAKFVVTHNSAVKQIWISALSTSFKLDWSEAAKTFVYEKTGENLKALLSRLINQQLGKEVVTLS